MSEPAAIDQLLARLDAFLSMEDDETSIEAVLRRPWRLLEHLQPSTPSVRTEILHMLEDLAAAEERVRLDYTGRYAMELLQNAHDACHDGEMIGRAWIQVTERALLVGNQGLAFDARRVEALLRLGGSSKQRGGQHHTIGYKGIGFSSVFEVTDRPQIISKEVRFGFDPAAAAQRVQQVLQFDARKVPIRRFPFPVDPADWREDAEAVDQMLDAGAVTVIRLPFKHGLTAERVWQDVTQSLPAEVLLFMPALDSITFIRHDRVEWSKRTQVKKGLGRVQTLDGPQPRSWLTASTAVAVPRGLTKKLGDELWEEVTELSVTVGLPWTKGRPDAGRGPQPLHVYFPTEDLLGRPLLVHGDFYVDSSRRHIEQRGPGGALSELVAQAAARLIAEMAERLASHGNHLLRCLAPMKSPSGYGQRLSELVDERLYGARICRSMTGGLHRPLELRRMGTALKQVQKRRLVKLLGRQSEMHTVGDDLGVTDYLDFLGCTPLQPNEVAERLSPREAKMPYERTLETVAIWYEGLSSVWSGHVRSPLRSKPLLQDSGGRWRSRGEVVIPDDRTPLLPAEIRPHAYRVPKSRLAREFAERIFEVQRLTPDVALDRLLSRISRGTYGTTNDQRRKALDFVFALWKEYPDTVKEKDPRLNEICVPVRASKGARTIWLKAGKAYFSERLQPGAPVEAIYGPLGMAEFVDIDPPEGSRLSEWVSFLALLGVASAPRLEDATEGHAAYNQWLHHADVVQAWDCPEGHPHSSITVNAAQVLDRLEKVLASGNVNGLQALATHLSSSAKPFGEPCEVKCGHSSHRGRDGHKVIGYQEWLLRTRAWIPVHSSLSGDGFRRVDEAWYDPPRSVSDLVPVAYLLRKVSEALGLVSSSKPSLAAVASVLETVAKEYPDLASAPDAIRQGSHALLWKLDAASTATPERMAAPPLPSTVAGDPAWSRSPLISDLPGLDLIPIACLPTGEWRGLRSTLELSLASERITVDVHAEPIAGTGLLGRHKRIELVTFLAARGMDLRDVAERIALLEEVVCSRIMLTLCTDDAHACSERRYHIANPSQLGVGSTLFVSQALEPADYLALATDLARYIGAEEWSDAVMTILLMGEAYIRAYGLGETQLEEASAALEEFARQLHIHGPSASVDNESLVEPASFDPATVFMVPHNAIFPEERNGSEEESQEFNWSGEPPSSHPDPNGPSVPGWSYREPSVGFHGADASSPGDDDDEFEREPIDADRLRFGARETVNSKSRSSWEAAWFESEDDSAESSASRRRSATERDATERDAIVVVTRFAEEKLGARVRRVDNQNLGWDLEFDLPGGDLWHVEAKGFAGTSSTFILTRNELDAARAKSNYRVAVVTGLASMSGSIAIICNVGDQLTDARLNPMSWAVDDWESMSHETANWSHSE